jgi:GNAT superfamily N-acetyltransferase
MKEKLTFEKISENNFEDFLYLVEKLALYEKLDPPNTDGKKRLRKDGLSKTPKYDGYIWSLNDKPIGYVIFFNTYSSFVTLPTFYIEDIFILEEYRRKGIGQKMFQFCVNEAKKRGCGRIEFAVLNWNKPAINFYEKNQAKPLSEWTYYRLTKDQIDNLAD